MSQSNVVQIVSEKKQNQCTEEHRFSWIQATRRESLLKKLGPIYVKALESSEVYEVGLNPNGQMWQKRFGHDTEKIGFMGYSHAEALVNQVAGCFDLIVNSKNPILECELPLWNGPRFEGIVPPNVSAPTFVIRKKSLKVYTLDDYAAQGIITQAQRDYLGKAVRDRLNILIVGGTGSGKTTFINAILQELTACSPDVRQIILEDTPEIQSTCWDRVNLYTSVHADMDLLLKAVLRLDPDRIFVGEVRDGDAYTLIQTWNTGHPGGAVTIHANDCASGIIRLVDLIKTHPKAPENVHFNIAAAAHVIVSLQEDETHPAGRVVNEMKRLHHWSSSDGYVLKEITG